MLTWSSARNAKQRVAVDKTMVHHHMKNIKTRIAVDEKGVKQDISSYR